MPSVEDLFLLEAVLDALDRLYDRKTNAVEVRALLFATSGALRDRAFVDAVVTAKSAPDVVLRSGFAPDEENRHALIATDELRLRIADRV